MPGGGKPSDLTACAEPTKRAVLKSIAAPVTTAERIDAIDVLRGIALLGVLVINLVFEFRVSIFQQFLPEPASATGLDRAVLAVLTTTIELKAFALFSFLFGVG